MKKYWILIGLLTCFYGFCNVQTQAAGIPSFLKIQSSSASSGETVDVGVYLETNEESITALQFDLIFDSEQLEFTGVHTGVAAKAADKAINHKLIRDGGRVRFLLAGLNNLDIQNGEVATVTFRVSDANDAGVEDSDFYLDEDSIINNMGKEKQRLRLRLQKVVCTDQEGGSVAALGRNGEIVVRGSN